MIPASIPVPLANDATTVSFSSGFWLILTEVSEGSNTPNPCESSNIKWTFLPGWMAWNTEKSKRWGWTLSRVLLMIRKESDLLLLMCSTVALAQSANSPAEAGFPSSQRAGWQHGEYSI